MCGDQTTSALEQDNVRMRATSRTIKNNMADQNQTHELVSDVLFEDHLVDMWPQHPCLYDVSSSDFKNRDSGEKALEEIAEKLGP